jgi:hypothetical protein
MASAPPVIDSRKPMIRPPRLETGIDTRASTIVATPANTRTMRWNHIVSPRVISSTPMISAPAPAVVAICMVRWPSLRW